MIQPCRINWPAIIRGDTWNPSFLIKINGSAVDLTTYSYIAIAIKEKATDTDSILTLTTSSGLAVDSSGYLNPIIIESFTSSLPTGSAHAYLSMTKDGETHRYIEGEILIRS